MDAVDTPACFDAALICGTKTTLINQCLVQLLTDLVFQPAHMCCYNVPEVQVRWGSGLVGISADDEETLSSILHLLLLAGLVLALQGKCSSQTVT